jgi:hypothetical protein
MAGFKMASSGQWFRSSAAGRAGVASTANLTAACGMAEHGKRRSDGRPDRRPMVL